MKKFDLIVIGLGPAGMAVSIMASEMGLKVAGIEKHKIGGECMNVGCIPSKAILREALNYYHSINFLNIENPTYTKQHLFENINKSLEYINDKKTIGMFSKVKLYLGNDAKFINKKTVKVGEETITAPKIFICTGTKPFIPPIPGIDSVDYLTNETIFSLDKLPKSMIIIGGGAIGSEMAQAFSRLGTKISIVHMDPNLMYGPNKHSKFIMEDILLKEGIDIFNSRKILSIEKSNNNIILKTDKNESIIGEKLLVAAGRTRDFTSMELEKANIKYDRNGIKVNNYLQTNIKHIYAAGDVNGHFLLSHAAMHQGMISLINSMLPWVFKMNFKKFIVPWTVFTDPQISYAGMSEYELKEKNIYYETYISKYQDYGAAIAENIAVGHVKILCSKWGKIYGAEIAGEGSGEMINEIALAIQNNLKMHNIMFLQHSFPTMGFLIKRVAESWMMKRMESKFLKKSAKFFFKIFK
ncbi:MAG: NAD(P)/FAD-dependent oxidoreductase [Candidatus Muirbacterium halophilum]|nr:NAD(P)/FAD-dependent oxidoreductase [Candidatus Muirbacterium halophilum]MCK9474396.1 NAD(P)/FAD-dependent oxidoreductase [Candidatus Muirbacterium halophilum]